MKHLECQAVVWIQNAIEIHHGFLSREVACWRWVIYVLNLDGLGPEVGDTTRETADRVELQ